MQHQQQHRPDARPEEQPRQEEFLVRCHCGRVQAKFVCDAHQLAAWDCNCSDCAMRKNIHIIVPESDFSLQMPLETLEDATILYQWGTKTASRRFCRTCGVLPWYRPRSNPDGVSITIYCVDWTKGGTVQPPHIDIVPFDGTNWEESMRQLPREQKEKIGPSNENKKGKVKFDWW
jgi:hypothetical protein